MIYDIKSNNKVKKRLLWNITAENFRREKMAKYFSRDE